MCEGDHVECKLQVQGGGIKEYMGGIARVGPRVYDRFRSCVFIVHIIT